MSGFGQPLLLKVQKPLSVNMNKEINTDFIEKLNTGQYGFKDPEKYVFKSQKGLSRSVVGQISEIKKEPQWMYKFRLNALKLFESMPLPSWGPDLSGLDLDDLYYYVRPMEEQESNWDDVPEDIKNTFDRLGIPEAEQKFLAGVGAQYESEMVYHSIQKHLETQGVIFLSIEEGLRQHPDLFREHFGKAVPPSDNKFAALNSAVWSGGSFVYVPPGVHVELPLQAYFRLNMASIGQFERSIIIADEGSQVHYVEGCTAPTYSRDSFHSGVIEIFVKKNARVRYTTIQNWSTNVYNLVTQRAMVYEGGTMEWVDSNLGSKTTMKYPSCYLMESGAHGEILSMAFAGTGQTQDAGGKMLHLAPSTTSKITSKSISKGGGRSSFRGLIYVRGGAKNSKSNVVCDALILDNQSRSDTYPTIDSAENQVSIGHEASVSKVSDEQLFYLKSRGLSEEQATTMVVSGFIEPLVKELPMEYAVEMNRLIQLQMEGSVG
jgi:Fe-S cluster assembly protein SufB